MTSHSQTPIAKESKLIIKQLSKSYGATRVIRNIDLEVSSGEIVGLIGPNGAGKTTLLNAVCGVTPIDTGSVWFDGLDLTGLSPHQIARLGIGRLFQDVRLFPQATVLDNVLIGFNAQPGENLSGIFFTYSRMDLNEEHYIQSALQIFKTLNTKLDLEAPAVTLSYGEQKLVALGRLLALDAKLLLVDEAAAGLSAPMKHRIARLIRQLGEKGKGIILSEHDLTFVSETCSRVCVLSEGRIITTDSPKEILTSAVIRRLLYGV